MLTLGRIYANAGAKVRYRGAQVRCGGGIGLVKYGSGCARVGAWVWLWAGDGVLQLRFKRVSADAHIR